MRVLISYEHLSPAQVSALRVAVDAFRAAGHVLVPVEFFGGLPAYGWTRADAERPAGWPCLIPDRDTAPRREVLRRFVRLIRHERADVVVFNGWFEPVAWWLAASRAWLGVSLVIVADSTEVDQPRWRVVEAGKRGFLRRVDAAFTAGRRQRAYLERLGLPSSRISTGCDVVDNARFAGIDRSGRNPSSMVVGTAARLVPAKNLDAALTAVGRTASRWPSIRWTLAGRGPLEESLRERARALSVPVGFLGFVSYDRIPDFYAGLDVYWQPSVSEPWGLTINEAMAAGLPVLASDRCGAVDDLVTPANGWRHEPDVESMEAALDRAVRARDRWFAMGEASRKIIADWDLDRFASGLLGAVAIASARGGYTSETLPAGERVRIP
jgi:glycosyltransferase involved in cell wall biosynthesis